jgi:hypothetical protein
MRVRGSLLALCLFVLAGCGGGGQTTERRPPPRLPHALAQSWAQQADAVAAALEAGDGCTALERAVALRTQVVTATNAHRVPRRYLEQLLGTANDLAGRIHCTPPAPPPVVVVTTHGHGHAKHAKPPKHGKHGKNEEGGD